MTRPLRVAIVDDEPLARARLARLLATEPGVDVVGIHGDGASAAPALASQPVDAVFLDVRMPEVDGFAMLARIPAACRPLVVFVSAHPGHAIEAFGADAVDYLAKPLSGERLHVAVERVRRRLQAVDAPAAAAGGAWPGATIWPERMAVPDRGRMRVVRVAEIDYALAQGNYIELRLGERSLLLRETMNRLAARLDPRQFLRIHRSRIVRMDLIEQVDCGRGGQYRLRLRDGTLLASGRSYRPMVVDALGLPAGEGLGR